MYGANSASGDDVLVELLDVLDLLDEMPIG
jgi:hypothetical protein